MQIKLFGFGLVCAVLASCNQSTVTRTDETTSSASTSDTANDRSSLEEQCNEGDLGSCERFGIMLYEGEGGPADLDQAIEVMSSTCEADRAIACSMAGTYLQQRPNPDLGRADRYLRQGCEGGDHGFGCYNLGVLIVRNPTANTDMMEAQGHFQTSCDADYGDGCANLALLLASPTGPTPNPARARLVAERGCELESQNSCFTYSAILFDGIGGPADSQAAINLLRENCDAGHQRSCDGLRNIGA